jgi:ABC-type nitrate/sulfonate/bicarbonate transport system substrate-binding protein
MKKNVIFALIVILAIAAAGLLAWYVSSTRQSFGAPQTITIGVKHAEANALIYIAEDRGFFEDNGIVVTMKVLTNSGVQQYGRW